MFLRVSMQKKPEAVKINEVACVAMWFTIAVGEEPDASVDGDGNFIRPEGSNPAGGNG